MTPRPTSGRKGQDWWDEFWRSPNLGRARALTVERCAEESFEHLAHLPLGSREPPLVLDLGCGDGDITARLALSRDIRLIATDLSGLALRECGRRGSTPRFQASAYELPLPDESVDAIVSFGYASVASYVGVPGEVARVLRPGGLAVVDFPNPSLYHWLGDPGGTLRWWRRYRDPGSEQYHFGPRGVAVVFGQVGLRLEAASYFSAYPPVGAATRIPGIARLDRLAGRLAGRALGRVMVARFRRER
ncbi:MAG: class I SAM-dependent methyltransferase [Chloroflexota bacterium]